MKRGIVLIVIIILVVVLIASVLVYYLKTQQNPVACTMEAKICSDGSSFGRTGPKCEFALCPDQTESWKIYINNEYGFKINFPDSWKGYSVEKSSWQGWKVDGSGKIGDYSGVKLVFKKRILDRKIIVG